MSIITIKNLTKIYSSGEGVFDLSFEVNKGEAFGYLGPNAAGKTTTIRVMLGFLNADNGSCRIDKLDCRKQAAIIQKNLGYIPGEVAFLDGMTGTKFLNFMAAMRGLKDRSRIDSLISRLDLDASGKIRRMSRGMKQKLAIIAAFMHDPAIYVMDEPTIGLDPLMRNTFIELILEEKRRGKTIFMSSHSFDEIERTCDRAGIIREGKLVAVEDINSLKAARRKVISVTVASDEDIGKLTESDLEIENISGKHIDVIVRDNFDSFIAALNECKVQGLDIKAQGLEQVFLKYYGQKKVKE
jgi:ABC-2 type transport system ATP-binding protein